MIYDCAIIGAGPAGIISAIQLKRSGLNVIIFEKNKVGGLLRNANRIENYLGFPLGISGKELITLFEKQLHSFSIKPMAAKVSTIKKTNLFEIYTAKNRYRSHCVIIATGTIPKKIGIPGEEELSGKKVFYEVADIPLTVTPKDILIIGGGDVAFDYALNLYERGQNTFIIMRNTSTCLKLLLKKAREKKIPYFENSTPLCLYEDGDIVIVDCSHETFKCDFVLIAVGREPAYPSLDLENGDGLFFVGDVKNGKHRQVHIATGDALQTAIKAKKYLENANKIPNGK
jgi:thioredoxin reductase